MLAASQGPGLGTLVIGQHLPASVGKAWLSADPLCPSRVICPCLPSAPDDILDPPASSCCPHRHPASPIPNTSDIRWSPLRPVALNNSDHSERDTRTTLHVLRLSCTIIHFLPVSIKSARSSRLLPFPKSRSLSKVSLVVYLALSSF